MLLAQGRLAEAGTLLEGAVTVHSKVDGPEHWRTAWARGARGEWRARTGDGKGANDDLQSAWAVLSKRPEDDARRKVTQVRMEKYAAP